MSIPWQRQTLGGMTALLIGISPQRVAAQSALTGTVLSGASLTGGAAGSTRLVLGSRVASPAGSWTEIVFSDGSSIVLGPGAGLTIHRMTRNHIGASGSGQVRIVAMDDMDVELTTAGAAITVVAADAVVQAVPHGSVMMMGGREIVVSQRSRRDTLRRPGFSVPLDGSGPQRDGNQQIVAALAPFASSGPSPSPAVADANAPSPAEPSRAPRVRLASPSSTARAGEAANLSTGLTAQSGSLHSSPALKIVAPVPAIVVPTTNPAQIIKAVPDINISSYNLPNSVTAPGPTPVVNKSVPDIIISPYNMGPGGGAPGPTPAPTPAPTPTPTPTPMLQPSFVAVDTPLLAKISGTAGFIAIPGTTTSVSAGLVPSNEHLTWGFFVPLGSTATPATALASPILTFMISSTALPTGSLQSLTGTATYVGGLIANTLGTSGNLRPTGQFAQTWNFGTRSGTVNAVFDGSTWRGVALTTLPAGLSGYSGAGTSTTDQRSIQFQGNFYNATTVSPTNLPGATGGTFEVGISSTGRQGTGGLFVGTRR